MIARVTATEVLARCREALGMPSDEAVVLDDALLAALARRSAGIHCPCSRATLRASLLECMHGLPTSYDSLPEAVDDAIEALIVGGDLLELSDVVIDDSEIRQTWVFAAPPSFVVRPSGSVFLFGIVPDQDTFLPSTLTGRVLQRGYTRVLEPQPGEDLPRELRELGLQQLSDSAWLKSPRTEDPADMLRRHKQSLASQPPLVSGIHDVQILDPARPVTYYRGRWTAPSDQNGTFIARRPQEFGAAIWCLVELREGEPVHLLDLPLARTRWRGCDSAWHLQTAIDHCRGTPQRYRRIDGDGVRFDFFSPLPQWSERRLMNIGKSVPRDSCLFSYVVPVNEADAEEAFLQQNLWLSRDDSSR